MESALANRVLRPGAVAPWAMVLAVMACVAWPVASAWAERRVALVIGNGGYSAFRSLPNALSDARLVARSLGDLGFEVETLLDASRARLEAALQRLARASDGADLALLFYADHGLQVGGENYLIPTDATLADARSLDAEARPLPRVMRAVQGARLRLVFLDACRDNPMAGPMSGPMAGPMSGPMSGPMAGHAREQAATRSLGRGLAPVAAADLGPFAGLGTLISFSTAPGTVALDGAGQNSPFASALARRLTTPGLETAELLRLVRRDVPAATKGRQVPWDNSSLTVPVVLRPRPVTTLTESDGRYAFTSPDGRRVAIGKNVVIGKVATVFDAPVTISPPP